MLFSLVAASSAYAQVSDEDWGLTLSVGPLFGSGATPPSAGPAVGFRASRGVHPLWNLHVEGMIAAPIPFDHESAYPTGGVFVGVSTALDVVTVVPWIAISAGMLVEPGAPDQSQAVIPAWIGTVGIDVRKRRDYSMGVQADVFGSNQPTLHFARYVRVAFRYTWMRSRGGI